MAHEANRQKSRQHRPEDRIVRPATEARQGEVVLDKAAIWIWLAAFVAAVATVYLTL